MLILLFSNKLISLSFKCSIPKSVVKAIGKGSQLQETSIHEFLKNFLRGKQGSQFLLYKYDNKKQNRR